MCLSDVTQRHTGDLLDQRTPKGSSSMASSNHDALSLINSQQMLGKVVWDV